MTVLLALAAAGCGNYSTEDLRFLAALPQRQDLAVEVPVAPALEAAGTSGLAAATAACTLGDATVWTDAKGTSDNLNRGVDWVVGLIDTVRRYPPTSREEDARTWGPFVPGDRPGRELRIVITRSYPAELDGRPRHDYVFEGRWKTASAPWLAIVTGRFDGASSAQGKGLVILDFDAIRALQMQAPDSPTGMMRVDYDRTSDPVTVSLDLKTGGFGVVQFTYGYAGWTDGSGRFDYRIVNGLEQALTVTAAWDPFMAGRLRVAFALDAAQPDPPDGYFNQCWDAQACLTYVEDPNDFSGSCAASPCGDVAACSTDLRFYPFGP